MRIEDVRTTMVKVPIGRPVKSPVHDTFQSLGCLLVFLDTDEGITGEGLLFALKTQWLPVFDTTIQALKEEVLGEDPHCVERLWEKLWRQINFYGHEGIVMFAIAAFDMACWDILGKAAGKPLYKLLGASRDKVPTYASGGLRMLQTIEELAEEAKGFVAKGFRAMKLRIGFPRMDEDVERVRAVRQAIGPEIRLMVDAHQGFTVEHAIRLGRKLEELHLTWFEEPVVAWDLEGSAQVAAALDLPIASGENSYARYGFRRMIESKAADILMPDLIRVGGITELMKVAHMAEAFDLPVTPHLFPEESMHVVASLTNATYVENMDWFSPLYKERIVLKDGMIVLPQRPGFGFTFDPEVIERNRFRE